MDMHALHHTGTSVHTLLHTLMHTLTSTQIPACKHTHLHACTHSHTHTHTTYTHACMHVRTCMCTHTHRCRHLLMQWHTRTCKPCTHTHAHTYACMHACTHTHTHMHTHTQWWSAICSVWSVKMIVCGACRLQEKHVKEKQCEHQRRLIDLQEKLRKTQTQVRVCMCVLLWFLLLMTCVRLPLFRLWARILVLIKIWNLHLGFLSITATFPQYLAELLHSYTPSCTPTVCRWCVWI